MAKKIKITKEALENMLMDIIAIDTKIVADSKGNEIEVQIQPSEKQAKIAAIKQLCMMRGYNAPEKSEVTTKEITLHF